MSSELCKSCIHHKVCMKDKNVVGDMFVLGNPMLFDNHKLYEEFKERERQGFPCDDYISTEEYVRVVRCSKCKYSDEYCHCDRVMWWNKEDDYCSRGEKDDGKIH